MDETFKPEGRNCITRGGQLAKWVERSTLARFPLVFEVDGLQRTYTEDGRHCSVPACYLDLVRYADESETPETPETPEKPKGPVVTKTVKRIVPGRYGVVTVAQADGPTVAIKLPNAVGEYQRFTAAELRAAAATLIELADALSPGTPLRASNQSDEPWMEDL